MKNVETDSEGVKRALERLLAWPELARSPQLANFLSYIVDRRLTGDAQSIKAYSIAVDVFGRPPDFDPQADPIVRVQARRLRGLLDQYYAGPGADEPLRIELPIGRYVPEFVSSAIRPTAQVIVSDPLPAAEPQARSRPRGHITVSWFVLLVLALGATALTYSLATLGPRQQQSVSAAATIDMPRLRVLAFQNLTGDDGLTPPVATFAVELVTVVEQLVLVQATVGDVANPESAQDDADFVLTGIVRNDAQAEGRYYFNAILTEVSTNSVVWNWSENVSREQLTGRSGIDELSQELVIRLGGHRGPLHARAREFLAQSSLTGQESPYLCGILFGMYRSDLSMGSATRALSCIEALPGQGQDSGIMLAARASLIAEAATSGRLSAAEQESRLAEAERLMSEALQLEPTSSMVWDQRARLYEARGQHEEAETAYRTALQRTAANIDASAGHARHLALTGKLDEAIPIALHAIDVTPDLMVPGWFRCVPAMASLEANAFQRAQRLATECARGDTELGSILLLLAGHGANDVAMVGQALPRIMDIPSFRGGGIMTRLRLRITDEALLDEIRTALLEAGVLEENLYSAF
jgi:tetratricopeptide (TPR) repeat protein